MSRLQTQVSTANEFLDAHHRLLCITGAGCSVASGIPTYRNHQAQWQRSEPILHQAFLTQETARKRYWARSYAGWPKVNKAVPCASHIALAELEKMGRVPLLATQNVDRLHQQAGHQRVIDLHGRLDRVVCLECRQHENRSDYQIRLLEMNPCFSSLHGKPAPDGDADLPDLDFTQVMIPTCNHCSGVVMPDVVFYGGSVPKDRSNAIKEALLTADGILVVGSSLMVFSAFRFVRAAHRADLPIAAINQGKTRADDLLTIKIEADCNVILPQLISRLR